MGDPAEDSDASYRAAPRARQFDPSTWSPESYAKAKSLTQRPFENPETGDQLLGAVSQYEQEHSAHPEFLDFDPDPAINHAVAGEGAANFATKPAMASDTVGQAAGPLGAKAQQLLNAPETAWRGFKEAGQDAYTSALNAGSADHGDEFVAKFQGEQKASALRRSVAAARARSPIATFAGDAVIQAPAMALASAAGLGAPVIGGLTAALNAHGRSTHSGLATIPETAAAYSIGSLTGSALDHVPGIVSGAGGVLEKAGARTGELADELMLRTGGASGAEIGKLSKAQVKSYAKTGRDLEFNKGLPTARDIEDRADSALELYNNKSNAIVGSLGEDATVAPDAIQKRIRQGKGKYAEGEYASQPYRDKLDEIADSVANMPQLKKPVTYHATPSENVPTIAREGLQPREGGKNYKLEKNKNSTYFATDTPERPIHEQMKGWAEGVSGMGGGKDMSLLRTTAPTQGVPGTNPSIRIRTEPTPVSEVQFFDTGRGAWRPLSQYGKVEPKLPRESPAPQWWDDDPLLALAPDNSGAMTQPQPSAAGDGLAPDGLLYGREQPRGLPSGASGVAERRPEVYGSVVEPQPTALPGSTAEMELGRDTVYGTAYDATPKLPPGSRGGALAQQQPQGGSAMTTRGITPDDLNEATVQPYMQGIPLSQVNKAKQIWGKKTNFGSDSLEQQLQGDVYGAYNGAIRSAAEDIMPGAGQALKDNQWNEHVALRYGDWARKRATAGNRLISPSDLGAAGFGAVAGMASGDPLTGAAIGGAVNRFARGREAAIAEKAMSGLSSGMGSIGRGASSLGQALEGYMGAPSTALGARAGQAAAPLGPKLMGAFAQDDKGAQHKQRMDEGKGYQASANIKAALAANPQAFGPHSAKLKKAIESGNSAQLSATLETLSHDNTFKQYEDLLHAN